MYIYIYKEELKTFVRELLACTQPNRHETSTALWNPYRRVSLRERRAQIRFSRRVRGEKPEAHRRRAASARIYIYIYIHTNIMKWIVSIYCVCILPNYVHLQQAMIAFIMRLHIRSCTHSSYDCILYMLYAIDIYVFIRCPLPFTEPPINALEDRDEIEKWDWHE